MTKVTVNGVELFYMEEGRGEAIIFLHGLTSNHHMLKQEMYVLKHHYRVIGVDARGHGESEKPNHYTLEDHIQDVISLMDYLHIERAHLIGMSMGTYVAQGVAIQIPERIKKMVLISGNTHAKDPGTSLLEKHKEEVEGLAFDEQLGKLSAYVFHQLDKIGPWMSGIPGRLTPEQQEIAADALATFDFRPDLHKVKAETLVISGQYDGLNPPEDGKEIANHIPGAQFMLFEQSGHAPNIEEQEKFQNVLREFFDLK